MAGGDTTLTGPDFAGGFDLADLEEGVPVLGHKDGSPVLLVLLDGEPHAVGASCTHYGGPLGEGLVTDGTVRCPWHHACFSLRTGEALAAPALNPLPTWDVDVRDGRVHVGEKREHAPLASRGREAGGPERVVIVGAGAAGSAAAEWLRREGYAGELTLVDSDPDAPYDRPNLSKDYLAGSAPEEWIPLRPPGFYADADMTRVVDRALRLDLERKVVELDAGDPLPYDVALLATGAVARTLPVSGADLPHVHTLRSLDDCRAIIAATEGAPDAVVVGASFIGLEVAASLRARGLAVTVVAPEKVPFEATLGAELGSLIRDAHVAKGVDFRLGRTLARIASDRVVLDDDTEVPAGLVVVGIGVRPETALAEASGLDVDDGVLVDDHLRTSDPNVYAVGDSARFTDPGTGEPTRIEHWVVAQRQGQAAARNILGKAQPYRDVPFFWTIHYDVGVAYVGHADAWDEVQVEDAPDGGKTFRYVKDGKVLAVATAGADQAGMKAEAEMAAELGVSYGGLLR